MQEITSKIAATKSQVNLYSPTASFKFALKNNINNEEAYMRWKIPTKGDERIIKLFALLPIEIKTEVKWLELCYIKQMWFESVFVDIPDYWKDIAFVTKKEYNEFKRETK